MTDAPQYNEGEPLRPGYTEAFNGTGVPERVIYGGDAMRRIAEEIVREREEERRRADEDG